MAGGQAKTEIREDGYAPALTCRHDVPMIGFHTSGQGWWTEGAGTLRARQNDSHENLVVNEWPADVCCTLDASYHKNQGIDDQHVMNGASMFVMGSLSSEAIPRGADDPTRPLTSSDGGGNYPTVVLGYDERLTDPGVASTITHRNLINPQTAGFNPGMVNGLIEASRVRRLTPLECERLQGFPDNWTAIPYPKKLAKDGPRYKALGNSMAVPVIQWLGLRIEYVTELMKRRSM
jgi:DNA (cytosine-5)-methyltransferase 1